MAIALIILAAGQGTRMHSDIPKVLHPVGGAPLLVHAMMSGAALEPERTIVVVGHGGEAVAAAAQDYNPDARIVVQAEQLGTGHAVATALPALDGFSGKVIVLFADTPLISPDSFRAMADHPADVVVLGFEARDPARYGRLVTHDGNLFRIVEFKDADADTRAIRLCNSGVIACESGLLARLVKGLKNDNAAGEYYLTDIVAAARTLQLKAAVVTCPESETLGVNTRADLAAAEAGFQDRKRSEIMAEGVTMIAPDTVYLSHDTCIGRDAVVHPHVVFGTGVTVESGAEILAFCHLEGCHISRGARVGPFARLRPGAELAEDVHVGNFVEIKNAILDQGVKVGHLSYLGDAHVGEATNIGAGTITCNYDGVMKHRTEIGKRVFVGSDTMLVAPVSIGDDAMTATGTVVTGDVPAAALAIARPQQQNKPGLAVRLMEKLRAEKARRSKDEQ